MHYPNTTLILVGHGSTENPDSSEPTQMHADLLRQRAIFEDVRCCFWKEEPSFREILYGVSTDHVYIVPNFISEGYFTQTVIPRELGLKGPITSRIINGKEQKIYYCQPVGNHLRMTDAILQRALETAPAINHHQSSLFIVGHGTKLNERSAKAAQDQVERIIQLGTFGEVLPAYMEEDPLISSWEKLSHFETVVVVPFFISDGLHSYQDIPVLLGIEKETGPAASQRSIFRNNPYRLRGKTLYYASSIGTEPMMAEVILDQVKGFDQSYHKGTNQSLLLND